MLRFRVDVSQDSAVQVSNLLGRVLKHSCLGGGGTHLEQGFRRFVGSEPEALGW